MLGGVSPAGERSVWRQPGGVSPVGERPVWRMPGGVSPAGEWSVWRLPGWCAVCLVSAKLVSGLSDDGLFQDFLPVGVYDDVMWLRGFAAWMSGIVA